MGAVGGLDRGGGPKICMLILINGNVAYLCDFPKCHMSNVEIALHFQPPM